MTTAVRRTEVTRHQRSAKRRLAQAKSLLDSGAVDQATEELKALVNKYPKDPDLWLELSYAARTFGRGDPTTYASVAHRLAPDDPRTNRELALALAHDADRLDEALDVMERLIERDETDALSWAILGAVRLAAGQPGLAEVAGKRALNADPRCVEATMVLGDTALTFGNLNEAGHWYERGDGSSQF